MTTKSSTWSDIAKDYIKNAGSDKFIHHFDTPRFLKLIGPVKGKMVLDLGCGDGTLAKLLKKKGAEQILGIDVARDMIKTAKANSRNIAYKIHDIETAFPEVDSSFDIIVAKMVLMYVKNVQGLVGEIHRLLVADGVVAIGLLHPSRPYIKSDLTNNSKYFPRNRYRDEIKGKIAIFDGAPIDFYYRSLAYYIAAFIENGFSLEKIQENIPDSEFVKKYPEDANKLDVPITVHLLFKKVST